MAVDFLKQEKAVFREPQSIWLRYLALQAKITFSGYTKVYDQCPLCRSRVEIVGDNFECECESWVR